MIRGITWTHTISLESFRSFRGPLFRKPVTGQELFLLFLTAKPSLVIVDKIIENRLPNIYLSYLVHFWTFGFLHNAWLNCSHKDNPRNHNCFHCKAQILSSLMVKYCSNLLQYENLDHAFCGCESLQVRLVYGRYRTLFSYKPDPMPNFFRLHQLLG